MDPNAALAELRAALADYEVAGPLPAIALAAERMYEAAQALDDWLSKSGFLPDAWQAKPLTLVEKLDAAKDGKEFGDALLGFLSAVDKDRAGE